MLLQDDRCMELGKDIYNNISNSGNYKYVANPLILQCPNVVEWMTRKVDHSSRILRILGHNFHGRNLKVSYQDGEGGDKVQ